MTVPTVYQPGDRVLYRQFDDERDGRREWGTIDTASLPTGSTRVHFDDDTYTSVATDRLTLASQLVADLIVGEVYAQLDELSDDNVGELGAVADSDENLNRLIALAEDLRETLRATVDVRVSDWICDLAEGTAET